MSISLAFSAAENKKSGPASDRRLPACVSSPIRRPSSVAAAVRPSARISIRRRSSRFPRNCSVVRNSSLRLQTDVTSLHDAVVIRLQMLVSSGQGMLDGRRFVDHKNVIFEMVKNAGLERFDERKLKFPSRKGLAAGRVVRPVFQASAKLVAGEPLRGEKCPIL